jgi:hypothetical protein
VSDNTPAGHKPGRSCPLHYRYAPEAMARASALLCETLYVVGGLYGNEQALQALLRMFEREPGQGPDQKRLIFNGDFHWFDTDPGSFSRISQSVLSFDALRGNVETELCAPRVAGEDVGCGCGYPDWVGDDVVQRSNRILQRLRQTADGFADLQAQMAQLPMWLRINVGALKLAVVHGDAESLAGWGFAQEHLQDPAHRRATQRWFEQAGVDAFACSHTCLPVFDALGSNRHWVLNNGAAGMPNFAGDSAGVLTRISTQPYIGDARVFGVQHQGVYMDALRITHDSQAWQRSFLAQWPPGSDAHASYWQRISQGPDYAPTAALRGHQQHHQRTIL